jgi:ribosomal-protein-alanine N-acetyltransferase
MIQIRQFVPMDVAAVTKVVKRSLGETYPPSLYLTVHNLWPEGFIVLEEDGRMVAFAAAVISGPKVARVLMLAVLPEHRRRSFGKKLMSDLYSVSLIRGLDTITLEVRKSNKNAISFYERLGFTVFGEIERFYSNGEGALKLMKVLQS